MNKQDPKAQLDADLSLKLGDAIHLLLAPWPIGIKGAAIAVAYGRYLAGFEPPNRPTVREAFDVSLIDIIAAEDENRLGEMLAPANTMEKESK